MAKRCHILSIFCFTVIAAFDAKLPVIAQETTKQDSSVYWLNVGFGSGTSEMAAGGSFSHLTKSKKGIITIRFIRNETFELFSTPAETVWDFGVLYGKMNKGKVGLLSISAGLSIVGGVTQGELLESDWFSSRYESDNFSTMGLPVNAQLFFKPFPSIGFGLNIFANLNPEQSFAGALLCFQVGRLH